jgi:hypothetical protein
LQLSKDRRVGVPHPMVRVDDGGHRRDNGRRVGVTGSMRSPPWLVPVALLLLAAAAEAKKRQGANGETYEYEYGEYYEDYDDNGEGKTSTIAGIILDL